MDVIFARCAGIDVHKAFVMVAITIWDGVGAATQEVRRFGTSTAQLRELVSWLQEWKVTHVAMESTGVFWVPVYNILEDFFDLTLANARHLKQIPGRKTDKRDARWIAKLMQHGLLQKSFIAPRSQRELRDLTRHRACLVDDLVRVKNRIHKVLEQTNVKLSCVASDIFGVSGRLVLKALMNGETDPDVLADLTQDRLKASRAVVRESLEGHVTPHHRTMLRVLFEQLESLEGLIAEVEVLIEQKVMGPELNGNLEQAEAAFEAPGPPAQPPEPSPSDVVGSVDPVSAGPVPAPPAPPAVPPQAVPVGSGMGEAALGPPGILEAQPVPPGASPAAHVPAYAAAVELLESIPGFSRIAAITVLAEIGDDMSVFPTASKLACWGGICPGNNVTGGKSRSGRTPQGNHWLKRILAQTAWAASHTKETFFQARFKRLSARRGSTRAVVAIAHSQLKAIHEMLLTGALYEDLGADHYYKRHNERLAQHLLKRLNDLGHQVLLVYSTEEIQST